MHFDSCYTQVTQQSSMKLLYLQIIVTLLAIFHSVVGKLLDILSKNCKICL